MNYIAHLHLAAHTQTSLLGNFLGDFVKGSQLTHLPNDIEQGIRLHRSVDSFTDSHPLIMDLKQHFTSKLRRMSGVVIDIYFDYLLMQSWHKYSTFSSASLFNQFYDDLEQFTLPVNSQFNRQAHRLISHRWLNHYSEREACIQAFSSIESRLNHRIIFAEEADCFLKQNHTLLETEFLHFYPELLEHGVNFVKSYKDFN